MILPNDELQAQAKALDNILLCIAHDLRVGEDKIDVCRKWKKWKPENFVIGFGCNPAIATYVCTVIDLELPG